MKYIAMIIAAAFAFSAQAAEPAKADAAKPAAKAAPAKIARDANKPLNKSQLVMILAEQVQRGVEAELGGGADQTDDRQHVGGRHQTAVGGGGEIDQGGRHGRRLSRLGGWDQRLRSTAMPRAATI